MTGAVFADVSGAGDATLNRLAGSGAFERFAGLAIDLGGDGFPNRGDFLEGGLVATGHEGRTEAGAFFTAGHAGTNEAQALGLELFFATDGVRPEGVAAVDDNVVLVEQRHEAIDHRISSATGLDQDDDLARGRERLDETLKGFAADEATRSVGIGFDESVVFGRGAVEDRDLKTVIGDVESEVLTHYGEADESDV